MNNEILVSIICTAYNHEAYIQYALDSFVMQKTTFNFEIIVSDDASTDNTAFIIKQLENRYPELFKTFYHSENQYSKKIPFFYNELVYAAKGKYIAICEGDDYWTDPYKLQKQIDFLEENPEFGLVYTKADLYDSSSQKMIGKIGGPVSDFQGLLEYNPIPTLTTCFKKKYAISFFESSDFQQLSLGDLPLWLSIIIQEKVGFINEVTATHILLTESASQSKDINKQVNFLNDTLKVRLLFLNKIGKKEYIHIVERMHYIKLSRLRLLPTKSELSDKCIFFFQEYQLKDYYYLEKTKHIFKNRPLILNLLYKYENLLLKFIRKII